MGIEFVEKKLQQTTLLISYLESECPVKHCKVVMRNQVNNYFFWRSLKSGALGNRLSRHGLATALNTRHKYDPMKRRCRRSANFNVYLLSLLSNCQANVIGVDGTFAQRWNILLRIWQDLFRVLTNEKIRQKRRGNDRYPLGKGIRNLDQGFNLSYC